MTRSLPCFAREFAAQAERLDDLLDLADVAIGARGDDVLRQEPRADQLLGDRRGSALAGSRGVLGGGREKRRDIDTRVGPERAVLRGGRGVEDAARQVLERQHPASLILEATELHLPGAVVHDRRLVERQVVEGGRIGQAGREDVERRRGDDRGKPDGDEGRDAHAGEHRPAPAPGALRGTGARAARPHAAAMADDPRRTGHRGPPDALRRRLAARARPPSTGP